MIKVGIIASGSGTDANAIMSGWRKGQIPNVGEIVLFGTKKGAGCFEKAEIHNIQAVLIECNTKEDLNYFNCCLVGHCEKMKINLLFLAGCVWEIDVSALNANDIMVANIHPGDTIEHGGRHMYGLAVHKHVLAKLKDEIWREIKSVNETHYSQICIHLVTSRIDQGQVIVSVSVPIPRLLVEKLVSGVNIEELATELQKKVLRFEHMILPSAVNIIAATN